MNLHSLLPRHRFAASKHLDLSKLETESLPVAIRHIA
jgi:hypothetical protein